MTLKFLWCTTLGTVNVAMVWFVGGTDGPPGKDSRDVANDPLGRLTIGFSLAVRLLSAL